MNIEEYRLCRLQALVQRIIGLYAKKISNEILELSDAQISTILDDINQTSTEIFDNRGIYLSKSSGTINDVLVELIAFIDKTILGIVRNLSKCSNRDIHKNDYQQMAHIFDSAIDRCVGSQDERIFYYLLGCRSRCVSALDNVVSFI